MTASMLPSFFDGWNRAVPSMVPPLGSMFRMMDRVNGKKSPSTTPRQPLRKPSTESPYSSSARFTTALMAAFNPGQSPPPVKTPMRTVVPFRPNP